MRDLTGTFFDGGSLHRMDYAAICIPNETEEGPFAYELIRFNPECFNPDTGAFRPEVLVWLKALAADDNAPLPFGGMA